MKSLLYIGLILMVGASIYGFADYKKVSRSKKFESLYNDKEIKAPVVKNEEKSFQQAEIVPAAKKEIKAEEEVVGVDEPIQVKTKTTVKKVKVPRKLNYKYFSRAPLREYQEEIIDVPAIPNEKQLKTDVVKPEKE